MTCCPMEARCFDIFEFRPTEPWRDFTCNDSLITLKERIVLCTASQQSARDAPLPALPALQQLAETPVRKDLSEAFLQRTAKKRSAEDLDVADRGDQSAAPPQQKRKHQNATEAPPQLQKLSFPLDERLPEKPTAPSHRTIFVSMLRQTGLAAWFCISQQL